MSLRIAIIAFAALLPLSAGASLVWDNTVQDIGTIREADGKVTCTYSCRNDGDTAIVISRVRTSCGCTTANYSKKEIMPGDTASLSVSYNPSFRPGRFLKEITVMTAGGGRYRLELCGKVSPMRSTVDKLFPEKSGHLRLMNGTLLIGEVKQGAHRTATLLGFNPGKDTLRLTASSLPPEYAVTADSIVAPEEMAAITVKYSPAEDAEVGLTGETLMLTAADGKQTTVEVSARVTPGSQMPTDFSSTPVITSSTDRIDLSPIPRKGKRRATAEIGNTGAAPLSIYSVAAADSTIRIVKHPKAIKPGEKGIIIIEADAGRMNGNVLNTSISVFSNDPANMTLQIRVVGEKKD